MRTNQKNYKHIKLEWRSFAQSMKSEQYVFMQRAIQTNIKKQNRRMKLNLKNNNHLLLETH